jgi:DNA invertase Pin-like site-specific DNA recombinase
VSSTSCDPAIASSCGNSTVSAARSATSSTPSGDLRRRGIIFSSLQESINTTTPTGKLVFHLFGALAEFERDLIHERTMAGLAAARARGRLGGRPSSMSPQKLAVARQLHEGRQHTVAAIAEMLGVSRATIYRHLGSAPTPATPVSSPRKRRR